MNPSNRELVVSLRQLAGESLSIPDRVLLQQAAQRLEDQDRERVLTDKRLRDQRAALRALRKLHLKLRTVKFGPLPLTVV